MATKMKITLSASRDIPFDKLVLSQANVRRVKAGLSIEELAEDIARRGLLQGLSVRAVVDADGVETGMYEIPAGGRRYRALQLLVKAKRLARSAAVPCIVREGGIAEEDSLAENVQRIGLHPLDQFRAFQRLHEKGEREEDIAAAFFVPVSIVKQRLKLASVSDKLLGVYADDGMTLDQLMAFTVSGDHARQEAVFERLQQGYDKQPYLIRRMLTETAVRAGDKRALFIGVDAYVEAGGCVMRDLFQSDEGGWLQDAALVELMVAEKLRDEAQAVRDEGWKWIEAAPDFAYGHLYGLRQLRGQGVPLTAEEQAARAALIAELEQLEAEHAGPDDLSEQVDARLSEIEAALSELDHRPVTFEPDDIARAGVFVSIDRDGATRIERGFIRPKDEPPVEVAVALAATVAGYDERDDRADVVDDGDGDDGASIESADTNASEPEEEDGIKPLSDRLTVELTSYRTIALRQALGEESDLALRVAVHALALRTFYRYPLDSCAEIHIGQRGLANIPGLADSAPATAIEDRRQRLLATLPAEPADLWAFVRAMAAKELLALFAHCVADTINAVVDPYERRPRACAHADRLASALGLDMTAQGWRPTVENYLGRVTKARILLAVAEGAGEDTAQRLAPMKKGEMAHAAEALLADKGWLPEPLRTEGLAIVPMAANDLEPGEPATQECDTMELSAETGDLDAFEDERSHAIAAE